VSWGYVDPKFQRNWALAKLPRLAYHVIYPGEDARRQTDHFLSIVKPGEHDRLVLDMELDHGYNKARITDTLEQCLVELWDETGRYPVVYSRASWVNQFLDVSRLPKLDWWLAGYRKPLPSPLYTPEATPPPALPNGVTNWLIHQTCEWGNGSEFGAASHYIDIDRWNTGNKEIAAFFGPGEETPPEPEPPYKLFDAKVYGWATPYVNVRKEPDIYSQDLGDLYPGTVVPVYVIVGDWYLINYKNISGYVMSKYLQPLGDEPPAILEYAYYGPVYSQRDIRWAAHSLGTRSTIGANGCLMTNVSMVCNAFGHASNPLQLNDWLTANEGYSEGNLFLWDAIERLYPDMHFDGFVYNPSTALIRSAILAGVLPIMFVDFNDDTPLIEMHWVLGIGVTGTDVIIADPWTGTIGKLSEMYPKSVIRYGSYRKQV